ncbi:MAG TPA: DUF3108 domain-containing protein [Longimicrobiales bacterium]
MHSLIRIAGIASAIAIAGSAPAAAQAPLGRPVGAERSAIAPVPFGPGERLGYKVKLGIFGTVGEGSMEVVGVDTIHGRPSYHLRFDLEGKVLFAEVDDRLQSWLDVSRLVARRFEQDQKEVNFERHRIFDFFPEEGRYVRLDKEGGGELASAEPLDDVSFLYFVRTLPLEVGQTYTFHRYYKADGNPVTLKVLRKETVTVPAGTFETIVVQPIIRTDGLFGEGGEAEVYFTDDDQRLLVQMKSKVPVIGDLSLHLESYTPGMRLAAADASDTGT